MELLPTMGKLFIVFIYLLSSCSTSLDTFCDNCFIVFPAFYSDCPVAVLVLTPDSKMSRSVEIQVFFNRFKQ